MPVYTKAPRARLAMPSDEDFTVLMPRTSAIPQTLPRGRIEHTEVFSARPAAGMRPSPVPTPSPRPVYDPGTMAAPPPTVSVDPQAYAAQQAPQAPHASDEEEAVARSTERVRTQRAREPRPAMRARAQAVIASADDTQPTRMRAFLKSRRGKIAVRAIVLLALGGGIGVGAEAVVQRRALLEPLAETSAAITRLPLSAPPAPPPATLSAASIASAQMQCTNPTASQGPAATPATTTARAQDEATPHRHHHRARPTVDVAQGTTPEAKPTTNAVASAPALPQDDIAAATEALSKAKEETTLP